MNRFLILATIIPLILIFQNCSPTRFQTTVATSISSLSPSTDAGGAGGSGGYDGGKTPGGSGGNGGYDGKTYVDIADVEQICGASAKVVSRIYQPRNTANYFLVRDACRDVTPSSAWKVISTDVTPPDPAAFGSEFVIYQHRIFALESSLDQAIFEKTNFTYAVSTEQTEIGIGGLRGYFSFSVLKSDAQGGTGAGTGAGSAENGSGGDIGHPVGSPVEGANRSAARPAVVAAGPTIRINMRRYDFGDPRRPFQAPVDALDLEKWKHLGDTDANGVPVTAVKDLELEPGQKIRPPFDVPVVNFDNSCAEPNSISLIDSSDNSRVRLTYSDRVVVRSPALSQPVTLENRIDIEIDRATGKASISSPSSSFCNRTSIDDLNRAVQASWKRLSLQGLAKTFVPVALEAYTRSFFGKLTSGGITPAYNHQNQYDSRDQIIGVRGQALSPLIDASRGSVSAQGFIRVPQ